MTIIAKTEAAYERKLREINDLYRKANPHWPEGEKKGDSRAIARDRIKFEMYKRNVAAEICIYKKPAKKGGLLLLLSDEDLAGVKLPPINEWIIPDEDCIKFHPKEYPKGVRLELATKCPCCEKFRRTIKSREWGIALELSKSSWRKPNVFVGGMSNEMREIYNLNPGICDECAESTYKKHHIDNHQRQAKTKSKDGGFWDGFFEGLNGDK